MVGIFRAGRWWDIGVSKTVFARRETEAGRWIVVLVVAAVLSVAWTGPAPSGTATSKTAVSAAAGRGTYEIKACYWTWGWGRKLLRYGNSRWGYRHIRIRHGWTPKTRRLVKNTLASYNRWVLQGEHTLVFRDYSPHRVRIVVTSSRKVPRRFGGGSKGIITAYERKRGQHERKRGNIPPLSPGPGDVCT